MLCLLMNNSGKDVGWNNYGLCNEPVNPCLTSSIMLYWLVLLFFCCCFVIKMFWGNNSASKDETPQSGS
jgi:hypothetical protein